MQKLGDVGKDMENGWLSYEDKENAVAFLKGMKELLVVVKPLLCWKCNCMSMCKGSDYAMSNNTFFIFCCILGQHDANLLIRISHKCSVYKLLVNLSFMQILCISG